MSEINEVIDYSSNDKLEKKTTEFKDSNSIENYNLNEVLENILNELKLIRENLEELNI